jgi:hypothetical protein
MIYKIGLRIPMKTVMRRIEISTYIILVIVVFGIMIMQMVK